METGDEETDGETTTGTEDEPEPEKKIKDMVEEQLDKKSSPKKASMYDDMFKGRFLRYFFSLGLF